MTCRADSTVRQDEERKPTVNDTTGGSSETDASDVAQNQTGCSAPAVMTATPLAWWRMAARNGSGPVANVVSSMSCS